ncbi:O-antigen ligase family protein [Flavivirga aquimarina]|uniref:O-antigen ligase family protein n=1 Tax=Flavivirga aquimarina TaxID=2027862 RepID=A0ABT8WBR2_9FLAO|nr:O-antigen ligase family protein [Flavivirga aquimarina]MDO5970546.1 O-antigen ligase family protein [Flavivirga aquimarina]
MKNNIFNNYINLVLLHIGIGFGIFVFKPLSSLYFLAVVGISLFKISQASHAKRHIYILIACAYVVGSEVFLRMTGGNFFYESSKYLIILFIVIGLALGDGIGKRSYKYIIYLLILVPGIIVGIFTLDYDTNVRTAIAFNLSGPICLGVTSLYCYNRRIHIKDLQNILLGALLPLMSITVYLFFYSPSIKDILSGTQSNFEASGGFGPNQVSTVLGLGVFLLTGRLFFQSKSMFLKVVNISILTLMAYRAIITFSRGGVFVAIIIILMFVLTFYIKANNKLRFRVLFSLFIFGIGMLLTWSISSLNTEGLIDKRYSNQDALGREKQDVTTGRTNLFANELNEFFENPFLGVGVGKLKELRFQKEGVKAASHNEMSRIVGEHGIFGIIAFSILLLSPLFFRVQNRNNIYFYSFYLFWFLTINHSSMRIAAPAFIYGLCLLNIHYDKPPLHRKQIIKQGEK